MVRQYQRAPLHILRPIHLVLARSDMGFVFHQQQGDGLVQGHRYRMDIDCVPAPPRTSRPRPPPRSSARDNFATPLVNLHVGESAVLEYLPDPIVPFRTWRLFQRPCLTAAPDATVILVEILLPGRVAHDEAHAYDLCWMETEVRVPEGTLLSWHSAEVRRA